MRKPIIVSLAALLLWVTSPAQAASTNTELRGIWMHTKQMKTRAETEQAVSRIAAAHLNAVFLLVWYGRETFYHSDLCPMDDSVEAGYDPLGAMVQACHARGIEVHAWFVNGEYQSRHVFSERPDWAVDSGDSELWHDFGKAAVRKFESDLMIECLSKYDLDGIHFDYIRYSSPKICYCRECQETFSKRYGCEPFTRGDDSKFPIFLNASGNPVANPTTAKVIVQFADGTPAITVNELGKGKVLLLNWHADELSPYAVKDTVQRALERWKAPRDTAFFLNTATNRARYGNDTSDVAQRSFTGLGYKTKSIEDDDLATLAPGSLLIMPSLYLIPEKTATQIEYFVQEGGIAVFIDGPAYAIGNASVQRVLGLSSAGRFINDTTVLQVTGVSDLAPSSGRVIDLAQEKRRLEKWAEFRAEGVTALVRDVYRRAKIVKPKAEVTAAVWTPFASAKRVCQDWPGWLREGIIDYVVPMAYTMDTADLGRQIAEWKTVDPSLARIVPGLSIYEEKGNELITRPAELVLAQHRLSMEQGAAGNVYFCLSKLSDPLAAALHAGPYPETVPAYHPPRRRGQLP
jgi:uncharacterized lipoprotein YddW (UPF0748 family)